MNNKYKTSVNEYQMRQIMQQSSPSLLTRDQIHLASSLILDTLKKQDAEFDIDMLLNPENHFTFYDEWSEFVDFEIPYDGQKEAMAYDFEKQQKILSQHGAVWNKYQSELEEKTVCIVMWRNKDS